MARTPSRRSRSTDSRSAGPSAKTAESESSALSLTIRPSSSRRSASVRSTTGVPCDLEAVEGVEDEPAVSPLHRREARAAPLVEGADLAVQHGVAGDPGGDRARDRCEAGRQILVRAGAELAGAAADVGERAVPVELQLVAPAAAVGEVAPERREHRLVGSRRCAPVRRLRSRVGAPDQEPVLLLPVEMGGHERPDALQPLARQAHLQAAVTLLLEQLVGARVPDLDPSRPVGAGRDLAGEGRVLERVILDVDGERLGSRLERDTLRHRPGGEHAVPLEPEVVMEAPGGVLLDDEERVGAAAAALAAKRLGRRRRVALLPVGVEPWHSPILRVHTISKHG